MNKEQIAKLKELAQAAESEVIRSHGWAGSVEMLETLKIDEKYLTAASPAAILELIAKVQTPLEDHNARFAIDGAMWKGSENVDPPPTEDHWLMPYWKMARELAEFKAAAERTTAPVDENLPLFDLLKRAIGVIALHDGHEAKTIAADARALLAAAPAPIQQDPQAAQLVTTTYAKAHSTTVIVNLVKGNVTTCLYSADHSANGKTIGVSDLPDGLSLAVKQSPEPCGGCGETDPSKRCIGCCHPFPEPSPAVTMEPATPPALEGSQVQAAGDVPWRVAEFWSSANPDKKCLMLAKDEQELSEWGKRSDFIRWCSPDPKAMREQP